MGQYGIIDEGLAKLCDSKRSYKHYIDGIKGLWHYIKVRHLVKGNMITPNEELVSVLGLNKAEYSYVELYNIMKSKYIGVAKPIIRIKRKTLIT